MDVQFPYNLEFSPDQMDFSSQLLKIVKIWLYEWKMRFFFSSTAVYMNIWCLNPRLQKLNWPFSTHSWKENSFVNRYKNIQGSWTLKCNLYCLMKFKNITCTVWWSLKVILFKLFFLEQYIWGTSRVFFVLLLFLFKQV